MGNKIARTTQASASEYYLHDLPSSYNLVLKEVLGRGRFFKSIQCKHDEGLVLVKVYFKRGDSIDLREYERRLFQIQGIFRALDHPHVWPFQFWIETDKAAYLLRQYFFNNLHDRLSTRPFLSLIEKKWLAFQLLCAVKQSHENGVCHGDIKCENVLVTSWNWLYLADFASFKPTYIPDDDPSDFSFFFDTGGRRLCYLAPESFIRMPFLKHLTSSLCDNPNILLIICYCINTDYHLSFGHSKFMQHLHLNTATLPTPSYNHVTSGSQHFLFPYRVEFFGRSELKEKPLKVGNGEKIGSGYRFYEPGGEMQVAQGAPLRPSMDIFAVGCVVAELFLEGQPLFELSQLLAYRRGQYDPSQHLEKIPDSGIRKMILHMIQLDPESRFSAESYLQNYASILFPSYFSPFLHNFYSCLNPLDSDTRVAVCQSLFHEIHKQMMSNASAEVTSAELSTPLNATGCKPSKQFELLGDINSLLKDVKQSNNYSGVKSVVEDAPNSSHQNSGKDSPGRLVETISNVFKKNDYPLLKKITMDDLNTLMSEYDSQSDTFGMPFLPLPQDCMSCEGMVLIASLLCSCIRNVKLPHLRRGAILLLKSCSLYIDDEDRLQRVLPYVIAMLSDPVAIVRCAALETLCDILPLVRDFPPSDAKIFPEYILPMLSMLPDDPEESVRICYARSISRLALTAYGFLIHSLSLSEAGVLDELNSQQKSLAPSTETSGRLQKTQLAQLRKSIAEVVQELVMGPKQTPNIRRALLQDIGNLCCFFGQRQNCVCLLLCGQRSVEEYLLPYIEQALSDATEAVIVNALDCLAVLCKSGFLRKRILLEMIAHAFPLLCYPSQWQPASLASEKALLSCLKPPVSRQVFYEVLENARSSDMLERQRKIWYNSSVQPKQWETVDLHRRGAEELNLMKSLPDGQRALEAQNPVGNAAQQLELTQSNNSEARWRAVGSFMRNDSSTVDISDPLCSDKLQFSGFMTPQIGGVNSFICDKSSEGIPLYSFSMDKRAAGVPPAASDSSLQLNSLGTGSPSLTWMDPVSKSFNLANSFPAPKLVSGSFSFSNGSKQFYRVVHEPESRENDQTAYVNSKFQDMGISGTSKGSSITVEDSSSSTDITGLPSFARTSSIPDMGWRPRGVLVAHLQEHRSAVNDIAISTDHSFFVSASDDSTVKVWDSRKLEKDISFRSRLTYPLEGSRALCTAMLRNSAQVIVGACDGIIHMFSVDYISRGLGNVVEKYSGIADIKKKDVGEGAILSLLNYCADGSPSQMVMYSTQNCGIHLWDTRTNSNAWTLKAIPEEGYVSSLVTGPCGNWFVSGSSRGVLTLWDLRFLVPVNSWQYSLVCPIEEICLFVPPPNASVSTMARPLIYVAAGCNEVSLWNAENGSCHQKVSLEWKGIRHRRVTAILFDFVNHYRLLYGVTDSGYMVLRVANNESDAEMSDLPWALARPSSKSNSKPDIRRNVNPKYRVDELNEPASRLPGIRSLLPLPGGDLLTGGTDLKIRRWTITALTEVTVFVDQP
ncbi:Serine/threonine-protein kinase VPS15 [Vitis vinifera]|uniref:non-specific serine/threonine protein kinase n=1 Tax=Vitis vinifera TaxID=29760 RepID=A0A438DS22_VITVI|nr:Serine/threonine-protein kinase VPS15 [Vitis vinifera]